MKVGDYVRTKQGNIFKLTGSDIEFATELGSDGELPFDAKVISPNIIDLIEVGDYVNGLPVERVAGTRYDDNDLRVWLSVGTYGKQVNDDYEPYRLILRDIAPKNIKSIVTKEQFEEMEYKL